MNLKINDFLLEDGSVLIPKKFVPFVDINIPEAKICLECGNYFLPTHARQKFCPPPDNVKRSRCENRFAVRKRRKKVKQEMKK